MLNDMSFIKNLKKLWRKSKHIRPAFWAVYRYRPNAVYVRARTDDYLNRILPNVYRQAAMRPVKKNLVLMVELRYDHISNSLQLLKDYMDADSRFDVHVVCMNSVAKKQLQLFKESKKLVAQCARAKFIFVSDGVQMLGCLPLRKETIIVQTWHACGAFKKFGMSTGDSFFGAPTALQKKHPAYGNINYITVSSPEVVWAYAEAMNRPEKYVHPVGVSRTDVFFDEGRKVKAYETLYEKFPAARGKKMILFAPTYRGHVKTATTVDEFKPELFAKALGDEYVLVTKHHPLVQSYKPLNPEIEGSFAYDATREMDIEDLLITADICITDYSSIIFEYSLLVRPMIFFAYDLDEYYDWRGFYYPYEEMTPGPVCKTNEDMLEYIRHIDERFDRAQVEAFRDRFMSACDGHATERIVEDVVREGRSRK